MFNSQVLEVAIGLLFVYLIVSTVCSGIKELIARFFDMRAKTLEDEIRNMLGDPNDAVTSALFQNQLIAGTAQPGTKPPYISSRSFALALFDVIAPAAPGQSRTVNDLKTGLANLPDVKAKKAILGLFDSAQQDAEVARQRVENWYDDTMERVSGTYKRKAQILIAILGFGLCVGLNVDSLMIVRELWNDEALRSVVVAQAEKQAETKQAAGNCTEPLKCVTDSVRAADVPPIGWSQGGIRTFPQSTGGWFWKFWGILISSVAVAMGAPFWFDLLNKIVNVRLTGSPPPDSREPV